jgi:hypothetical protein
MSGTGDDRGAMLEPMRRIIDAIEGAAALDRLAVSAQETARPLSRGRLGQALRGTGSAMPSTPCSQTCRWVLDLHRTVLGGRAHVRPSGSPASVS